MIDQGLSVASCPLCGAPLDSVSEEREITIGRRSARALDEFGRCVKCGESFFYAPGQMDATLRRALKMQSAVRRAFCPRRQSEESGRNWGSHSTSLRTSSEPAPRPWYAGEKGTVFQNRSTDSLLRVIDALPESAPAPLSRLHGVTLRDHSEVPAQ